MNEAPTSAIKQFIKRLACFALPLLVMPVLIYLTDPFGIFRTDFSRQVIEPNQHFAKMEFLTQEIRPYDSFIFGSSKAGNVDSRKLVNGNFYNMSYSMGLPYEWYHDLKILLEAGYDIHQVVLLLDERTYNRTHQMNNSLLRHPFDASEMERWKFKAKYLFRIPNFYVLEKALYPLHQHDPFLVQYDIHGSGIPFKTSREAWVDANLAEHLEDPRFSETPTTYLPTPEEALAYIAHIRDLCSERHIELTVMMAPIHPRKMESLKVNRFDDFLIDLEGVVPYLDFSGANSVNRDNKNWLEQHHFRWHVGDLIVERLNTGRKFKDFGVWRGRN
ncbi:MAG: hypothetical protein AAGI38_05020 [Bacteroidota bacterium]